MRPQYSITTQPVTEPITLAQASEHLRVDSEADQELIEALISTAREYADSVTGRVSSASGWKLIAGTWDSLRDNPWNNLGEYSGAITIPIFRTPLVSVASVKYIASGATSTTTMSTGDYTVITASEPGMILITGTLPALADRPDAIQIEFTAGYASPYDVPAMHRHAIKVLVANFYEQRSSIAFGQSYEIPHVCNVLLSNQKIGGWVA